MSYKSTSEQWSDLFYQSRQDKDFHLGMGDIRVPFATQEDIVAAMERLEIELAEMKNERDMYFDLASSIGNKLTTMTPKRDALEETLKRIAAEEGRPMSMRVCSAKYLANEAITTHGKASDQKGGQDE